MEIFQNKRLLEREHGTRSRMVVKLGSSTVCESTGAVRTALLGSFAEQTLDLRTRGVDTVFVSSGAVAVGRLVAPEISDKGLLSDVGQSWLTMAWIKAFFPTPVVARVFTDEQLADQTFLRNSIESVLHAGAIPLINSANPDTNNDFAGRQIAHAVQADTFALLTGTDGILHEGKTVPRIHSEEDLAGITFGEVSLLGTGGMGAKSGEAWRFAQTSGREAVIAHGFEDAVLHKIAGRERIGTLFAQL